MSDKATVREWAKIVSNFRDKHNLTRGQMSILLSKTGRERSPSWIRNLEKEKAKITDSDLTAFKELIALPNKQIASLLLAKNLIQGNKLSNFLSSTLSKASKNIYGDFSVSLTLEMSRRGTQTIEEPWLHEYLYEFLATQNSSLTIISRRKSYLLSIIILSLSKLRKEKFCTKRLNTCVSELRDAIQRNKRKEFIAPDEESLSWFNQKVSNFYINQELNTLAEILEENPVSFFHYHLMPENNMQNDIFFSVYAYSNDKNFGILPDDDSQILKTRYEKISSSCKDVSSDKNSSKLLAFKKLTIKDIMRNLSRKSEDHNIFWYNNSH